MGYSDFGYGAASAISYWGMYPGHNCTNYAAFRLIKNGVDASYLRGQGDAYQWGGVARSHGVAVDGTPRVGDIAWWDSNAGLGVNGHVAYVEQVGNGFVVVSQDAIGGNFSWVKYSPAGGLYPTRFIHFGGARDLVFIKTKNTGSRRVEVHTANASSGYRGSDLHAASWFGTGDQGNGWFQILGAKS
jgi:surface antigen